MSITTYWSSERRFTDNHWLAVRYTDEGLAGKRMKEPTFPKESKVDTIWCNKCGAYHIIRPSSIPLGLQLIR